MMGNDGISTGNGSQLNRLRYDRTSFCVRPYEAVFAPKIGRKGRVRFGLQKEQAPLPSPRDRTTIRHAGIFIGGSNYA